MDNYWCTTPLLADESFIQIKVLYEVKYIGFLVSDPKKEDLVSIPNSVVHPLDEQRSSDDEGFEEEGEKEKVYCCGKELEDEDWIHCDYHKCEKSWYHFSCVGITKEPIGKWYCPNCVKILEKKLDLYEKSKTIKTIYNIRKSQSLRVPSWLANQYKGLKLAVFKIPFRFSEKFRDRCRENLVTKLKEKEKEKEKETETKTKTEKEKELQEKQNFLSLNQKCKYWYYSGTSLANASRNLKLSFDFSLIFSKRILKIMEILQFSKPSNIIPLQVLKSSPIKNEEHSSNVNENEKQKEKDQQVTNNNRKPLNKNLVRSNKRKYEELNGYNNSKNGLREMEEMDLKKRSQAKSTISNNMNNNDDQDINFIESQLKDNLFTRRDSLFGNPKSWQQQQQQQKRNKYFDIFSPTLEEETFMKKLSQLEKDIYSFLKLNQKKYQYWKFGYN
ncbi:inhibitor of growth protein [Anaeramoeba flamelloides]|uniref:Inhibitor of growth protein n=1 Tax=Anaeramoeba flamelloides TaxID=1746091 RepID=A0ABQ8YRD0_9EUKA|nr:inhibitor of growth protein [Anaeramoeba flamelloides]